MVAVCSDMSTAHHCIIGPCSRWNLDSSVGFTYFHFMWQWVYQTHLLDGFWRETEW